MDPAGAQGSATSNTDQRLRPSTSAGEEEDSIPACQSCRKRKLKCLREQPSCSQCLRLAVPCLYDHKKQRPGLKSGAVENLSRRLEVLENILLDSQGNQKVPLTPLDTQGCLYHASLLIANELKSKGSVAPGENRDDDDNDHEDEHHNTTTRSSKFNCQRSISTSNGDVEVRASSLVNLPRKRKHEDEYGWATLDEFESLPPLPSPRILDAIVDAYFVVLQPWIPFLHKPTFKAQFQDPQERPKLTVLLHALVSATLKHVKFIDLGMDQKEAERQVRVSRNVVKLHAMGNLSVENLQALSILAFDYMGGGQISKAWPIIGSLTRTVEYLRLTVEPDEVQQQTLLRPHTLLEKPKQWTEVEMRRRVFWNVFLLDRFCSVTSGWSTSLTSDDVHRRLPCDGKIWSNGEPAVTPYFGIWDKSAAKIGNSIAYIRSLYPSPSEQDHHMTDSSPGGRGGSSSGDVDVSKLGAFAYRIESTESLSQVTSFFLQQHVDFRNRQEVGAWLTRFKELDLRLVHWKMFLPQKWKDSNVSRDVAFIKMDPNLTLAHITHNTSMILLHQHIAYPPVDWAEIVKLPSSCSAETCQLAAVETASIAEKYLRYTGGIVNSQFAFCAFVAARVFLVHWRFCNTDLSPEFFSLIDSLQKMSDRWWGYQRHENTNEDGNTMCMAGKYALYLRKLHLKCQNEPNYCLNILGYSDATADYEIGGLLPTTSTAQPSFGSLFLPHSPPNLNNSGEEPSEIRNQRLGEDLRFYPHVLSPSRNVTSNLNQDQGYQPSFNTNNHLDIISNTSQLLPHYASQGLDTNAKDRQSNEIMRSGIVNMNGGKEMIEDELTAMSHSLLGQQFLELDRVITLEGTDFDFDMRNWGAVS